jgi:Cof subfamily protein (haloacid dehalogenase superfamily)
LRFNKFKRVIVLKYKLVAMDMDGTLLNSKKEVSDKSKQVLQEASNLGIKLVVCTGRIFTSARFYARLIGTSAPIIASNGAYIREKDRDEAIFEEPLKNNELYKIVETIKSYGLHPQLFTTDSIFTEKIIHFSKNYARWNESVVESDRVNIEVIKDFNEAIEKNVGKILKVVVMDEDKNKIISLKSEIKERMDVAAITSVGNNIEIMSSGISKGSAVSKLAEYYGILAEEVICIGDNENDLSMIEYAGLGIAMGNATEELKKAANYITDTNDSDGVAKAIEKFIMERR